MKLLNSDIVALKFKDIKEEVANRWDSLFITKYVLYAA